MSEPKRNPKRKASDTTNQVTKLPDEKLLEEALAPLSSEDIQEWEGWIELESEPVSTSRTQITYTLSLTSARPSSILSCGI
jgi:hypothetical protein